MTSPFASPNRTLFGAKAKDKPKHSPENIQFVVDKNQIVTAMIPFGTHQAQNIRQHMHQHVLTADGAKVFIFRQSNGWTNVDLQSTATSPKITATPTTVLKIAFAKFSECKEVGTISWKWSHDSTIYGQTDIDNIDAQLIELPAGDEEATLNEAKTDGEMIYDKVVNVEDKVDALSIQATHIIESINKLYRIIAADPHGPSTSGTVFPESDDDDDANDSSTIVEPTTTYSTPVRSKAAGKQPAKQPAKKRARN